MAALLAACSGSGFVREVERETELRSPADAEDAVYRDLIAQLLQQEKYYAALAHIEEHQRSVGDDDPRLSLYEARALYGLRLDGQAKAIFLNLRGTRYDAEAHHGLGLIDARDAELEKAIEHFILAVRARPTNVAMRNDLGFALLRAGRPEDARLQLSTALELEPSNQRARTNLMLLMLIRGDEQSARQLAESVGMTDRELAQMRDQAERLRATILPSTGG
ncbi:hypothetical protein [Algiphilus sp.]|uniref:hypothetical protein n=1 Tax=Algiphilus sp. TaxID=1872431 RepID=UPI003B51C649